MSQPAQSWGSTMHNKVYTCRYKEAAIVLVAPTRSLAEILAEEALIEHGYSRNRASEPLDLIELPIDAGSDYAII